MSRRVIATLVLLVLGLIISGATCEHNTRMGQSYLGQDQKIFKQAQEQFQAGDYASALLSYTQLVEQFPESKLVPKSHYMIARCYIEQGMAEEAKAKLEFYIDSYLENSVSPLAGCADLTMAEEYLRSIDKQIWEQRVQGAEALAKSLEDSNYRLEQINQELRQSVDEEVIYLEISLEEDLLNVKMSTQTLYSYPIVSGKGEIELETTNKKRDFSTPAGVWKILGREKDPVWLRPDWSWEEKGEEVPEELTKEDRAVEGVLGPYRLNMGLGYSIHGTASGKIRPGKYSHGCIRMNNEDLEKLWEITKVGTLIYIY